MGKMVYLKEICDMFWNVPFDVQTSLKYVFSFKSTKWKRDYFGNICCQTKNNQVCGFLNLLDEVLCQTIQLIEILFRFQKLWLLDFHESEFNQMRQSQILWMWHVSRLFMRIFRNWIWDRIWSLTAACY